MKTDSTRKAWLASLKPGDLVKLSDYDACWRVSHTTYRSIYLHRDNDGIPRPVSRNTGFSQYLGTIEPPTPAEVAEWKRRQLLDRIHAARWSDVPVRDLRRVVAIVEKHKAGR